MIEPTDISSDADNIKTIERAIKTIVELDNKIPEGDMETSLIQISAQQVYDICTLLTDYVFAYEDYDLDSSFEFAETEYNSSGFQTKSEKVH